MNGNRSLQRVNFFLIRVIARFYELMVNLIILNKNISICCSLFSVPNFLKWDVLYRKYSKLQVLLLRSTSAHMC